MTSQTASHLAKRVRLVVMGASMGGREALLQILPELPADFPCVIVVQHILKGFTEMLGASFDRRCQMQVGVAWGGEAVQAGRIYLAGDGRQLMVERKKEGLFLRAGSKERISGHCPSVDALFASVAECAAPEAVGVILTGMGKDGAAGLLALRQAGAYTIGQDKASSAVYGMPRVAFMNGAVKRQIPLAAIAGELIRYVKVSS